MLFILAIDPLQCILDLAARNGILSPVPLTTAKLRTSLYDDDAVEREMCPWAISKYFGGLVSNTSA
jgi:hypothetical protein